MSIALIVVFGVLLLAGLASAVVFIKSRIILRLMGYRAILQPLRGSTERPDPGQDFL